MGIAFVYIACEMLKYWVAVASRDHVNRGVAGSFIQVYHGKPGPLRLMKAGDWLLYYSPTEYFGQKDPCRRFTAIAIIGERDPYPFKMSEDFIPWRRDVSFFPAKEAPIEPLLANLSFIPDIKRWGFPFRRGCFSINREDFCLIASAMDVTLP